MRFTVIINRWIETGWNQYYETFENQTREEVKELLKDESVCLEQVMDNKGKDVTYSFR